MNNRKKFLEEIYEVDPSKKEENLQQLSEESLRKIHHQMLLEKVYELDPLIKKAAEKLQRLSEDPEVVEQYYRRESELAHIRSKLGEKDAKKD